MDQVRRVTSDSNSDVSSEDGSSDVSDLDKFEEAYSEFQQLTAGVDLRELERHASGQSSDDVPGLLLARAYAKDLVLSLAFHLAERIATLMRQVLDHPTKVLYDPENEVLFLPQFWLLPIYRELLNTASRTRPSRDSEVRRAASGLVKVLCLPNDSAAGGKGTRKGKPLKQGGALARFPEWFGSKSLMNTLYVWFPASWGPSVVEAISKRNAMLVSSDSCTLKGYSEHHGSPRLSRPAPPGARTVPLNDVLCMGRMISTFA